MQRQSRKILLFCGKKQIRIIFIWLRNKKESITNEDNCFQNVLNDSLDYQRNKKTHKEYQNLKPYINQRNWKDINFHRKKKTGKSLNKIIRKLP